MRYYVVSDVHGFFDEMMCALEEQGFFADVEPHRLVVCGDLFDRGMQARELQDFIVDLLEKDSVVLVRGNHEDLMMELMNDWEYGSYRKYHHRANGTLSTVLQLTGMQEDDLDQAPETIKEKMLQTPFLQTILSRMLDYYETGQYVFVHGWIPCRCETLAVNRRQYFPIENWRQAGKNAWNRARWVNGMEAAHDGVRENGKTIVCGHWHASFGHAQYEGDGGEFDDHPNFSPYYGDGIIAIDACTAFSHRVNCIVLEDETEMLGSTETMAAMAESDDIAHHPDKVHTYSNVEDVLAELKK